MEKILIVDDDKDISYMLKNYLSSEVCDIRVCHDGLQGVNAVKEWGPSIVLLDVMMPHMDGYTALTKIREFSNVPVILLTAKGQQVDKAMGFIKGCDDYMVKPFDLTELSFRIKAILKRVNLSKVRVEDTAIRIKDLEILKEEFRVIKNGEDLKLTKKEFDILVLLASNKGRIYSSKNIYEALWNDVFLENDNAVLTHMRNLREKIGDSVKDGKYIKTIWGVGYKVEKDN